MMNVNIFCRLTCSRFVCHTPTSVVSDAQSGIKFYLRLKHVSIVVAIKHEGIVLKQAEYRAPRCACDVELAAYAARKVLLLASGIVRMFLETRTGLRTPSMSVSIDTASRAIATYTGTLIAVDAADTGTVLFSNGVHVMFYEGAAYVRHNGRTRTISTRGGAWQPIVGGATMLVNCHHTDAVVADLCHTVFAMSR